MDNQKEKVIIPIPTTASEMMEHRKADPFKNMTNAVEAIYLKLIVNEDFRSLLQATDKTATVEGSFIADDFSASIMIREFAESMEDGFVENARLMPIRNSLNVVLRRYKMSRKERKLAEDEINREV